MSQLVPVSKIKIAEDRQRKSFDGIDSLAASIHQIGQITPIVIDHSFNLIAGERRLRAFILLGREEIRAEFMEDLSTEDAQLIELEENVKRQDLSWQEEARAILKLHRLLEAKDPEWNETSTSKRLSISTQWVSITLRTAEAMEQDPKLAEISSLRTAYASIQRNNERRFADALSSLHDMGLHHEEEPADPQQEESVAGPADPAAKQDAELSRPETSRVLAVPQTASVLPARNVPPRPRIKPAEESILVESFLDWSKTYKGAPFNFIHCDFPYAAGAGRKGSQINAGGDLSFYEDSEEIFWKLCHALLDSMNNVVAKSAHIMFWHLTALQYEVYDFFKKYESDYDLRIFPVPLVWHKTDNTGVAPDPARRPRHIYESAFVLSRGDRKITQPLGDVYGAPVSRSIHPAEKPVPMLQHFFRMFVSDTTRMLDPTCGSATSLRAAESLGAEHVLGLEINPEFATPAKAELASFRTKKLLAEMEKAS